MRTLLAISAVGLAWLAGCSGDAPDDEAGPAIGVTDQVRCVQLGGGWTFHYSDLGSAALPPGAEPTFSEGMVAAGDGDPTVDLEASRAERIANGWTDTDMLYAGAAVDPYPVRSARSASRMSGGEELIGVSDLDHGTAIAAVAERLDTAPAC